jgi:hypothetical protein
MMQQLMLAQGKQDVTAAYVTGATGVDSAVIPAHSIGDLIIGYAFNDGDDTIPALGAGFTNIEGSISGSGLYGVRLGYRIATVTNTASGTWTNADAVGFVVYSNAAVGTFAAAGITSNFVYQSFTPTVPTGSSLVLGLVAYNTGDTNAQTAPSGMTNRQTVAHASDELAIHESTEGRYIWPSTTVTLTGTAGAGIVYMLEIKST